MKNITDFDTLKASAVQITRPMMVHNPVFSCPAEMNLQLNAFAECTYNVDNGVVAFKDHNNLYVIPYTQKIIDILESNGIVKGTLYVPFADGGYPIKEHKRWNMMLLQAQCEQSTVTSTEG